MKVGLIGCGQHGINAVLPGIQRESQRAKLVAVCDLNPENLARISDAEKYTDYRLMLDREDLDVVYIATLADAHPQMAKDAFDAGCHVVCEKPMAHDVESCRAMIRWAETADRQLFVTFETRYHDHHRKIKEWITAGYLGRIEAIHLHEFWDGHKTFGPYSQRRARLMKLAGGLDCGIHKLDLVRYFCGGAWQQINAQGAWFGEELDKPPHIGILGRLDNGVMATVNVSMAYAAYIIPQPMIELLNVVGTHGIVSLAVDMPSPDRSIPGEPVVHLISEKHQECCPFVSILHSTAIARLMDDLAEVIEDGNPPVPELATGEDGLMAQIAVEEANDDAIRQREMCCKCICE